MLSFSKIQVVLIIIIFSCKQTPPPKNVATSSENTTVVRKDHKLTVEEVAKETNALKEFIQSRNDIKLYAALLKRVENIFPSLYKDDRYKLNLFIPLDKAFNNWSAFKLGKLKDNIPDDFELAMINHNIVITTDFGWTGATGLSGKKLTFTEDKNFITLDAQKAKISEVIKISDRTKLYLLENCIE